MRNCSTTRRSRPSTSPCPTSCTGPGSLAAADAGKHVLCEKPLSLDAVEAASMVDALPGPRRDPHGSLHVAAPAPHRRGPQAGRRRRHRPAPKLIRASFSFTIDPGDWRLEPGRGAGALWDIGTYGVSTARLYAGAEPDRIHASGRFGPDRGRPLAGHRLEFPRRSPGHDRLQLRAAVPLPLRTRRDLRLDRDPRRLPPARSADRHAQDIRQLAGRPEPRRAPPAHDIRRPRSVRLHGGRVRPLRRRGPAGRARRGRVEPDGHARRYPQAAARQS